MNKAIIRETGNDLMGTANQICCLSDADQGGVTMNINISGTTKDMDTNGIQYDDKVGSFESAKRKNKPMGKLNLKMGISKHQASLHCRNWIEPGEAKKVQEKETITTFS
jgi:hypothetical protein